MMDACVTLHCYIITKRSNDDGEICDIALLAAWCAMILLPDTLPETNSLPPENQRLEDEHVLFKWPYVHPQTCCSFRGAVRGPPKTNRGNLKGTSFGKGATSTQTPQKKHVSPEELKSGKSSEANHHFQGGGNWWTLKIPREDWGTLRGITTPPGCMFQVWPSSPHH